MSSSDRKRRKVLALGREPRSLLAVVRSLGRKGIEVHVGWCPLSSPVLWSRYVRRLCSIPAFSEDDDSWKRELAALMRREDYDLVIPCDDASILPLQVHRKDLEPHGRVYLLSDRAFEVTNNKLATSTLARQLGIPVPREKVVREPLEAKAVAADFGYPVVLKSHSSVGFDDLTAKRFVQKVYDARRLQEALEDLLAHGPVQVQENVLGVGAGVEVLADRGTLRVAFQHLRVHEPPFGGGSSYRRSTVLYPELLDATMDLIKALDYTGVAMVEYKIDRSSGRWALMEINGRFWGSLPLAVAAGADFPYYLYQLLVESRRSFPRAYKVGLYARNWSRDAFWLLQNWKADRSDSTLTTVPLPRLLLEVTHLLTLRERSDTFTLDDPWPGLAEISALLRKCWSWMARRLLTARDGRVAVTSSGFQESSQASEA